jgi:hypothetical protein
VECTLSDKHTIHLYLGYRNRLRSLSPSSFQCQVNVVGAWPIEVAKEYPRARVVGFDLAPIQPEYIPINCEFVVGDLRTDLDDFHACSADLVQSRYVHLYSKGGTLMG